MPSHLRQLDIPLINLRPLLLKEIRKPLQNPLILLINTNRVPLSLLLPNRQPVRINVSELDRVLSGRYDLLSQPAEGNSR